MRVPLRLLTACALAVAPAVALAAAPLPNVNSPKLWATIDACSPAGRPGAVGIRGSLPGTGDAAEQMYMQFRIEYQRAHRWVDVGPQAETGWEALGAASARSREAGQDFTLAASAMHSYLLRGVVTYQWRLHGHVLFTTIRSTSAGHRPGAGADPRGYSAADCRIEAKRRGSLVMTPVTPRPASRSSSAASLTVHT